MVDVKNTTHRAPPSAKVSYWYPTPGTVARFRPGSTTYVLDQRSFLRRTPTAMDFARGEWRATGGLKDHCYPFEIHVSWEDHRDTHIDRVSVAEAGANIEAMISEAYVLVDDVANKLEADWVVYRKDPMLRIIDDPTLDANRGKTFVDLIVAFMREPRRS